MPLTPKKRLNDAALHRRLEIITPFVLHTEADSQRILDTIICCGEGRPSGAPLLSGGPNCGFLCGTQTLGGCDLIDDYSELGDAALVYATEQRTDSEIDQYVQELARVIAPATQAQCAVQPKFNV